MAKRMSRRGKRQRKSGKRRYFLENYEFLKYLAKLSPQRLKSHIKGMDKNVLKSLAEICLNLRKKNVPLSPKQKAKLQPYEEDVYQMSLKTRGIGKKKKIIQKGGFLGTLLGSVLPILLSTVIGATKK